MQKDVLCVRVLRNEIQQESIHYEQYLMLIQLKR